MRLNQITLRTEFFEEDGQIIGMAPEINVSSFGANLAEARHSLQEAIELWLEECARMGTLAQVLHESGFRRTTSGEWVRERILAQDTISVGLGGLVTA